MNDYRKIDFTEKLTAKDIHTLANYLEEIKGWLSYYSTEEFEKLLEEEPDLVEALDRMDMNLADYAHSCRWYMRKHLATSEKYMKLHKDFYEDYYETDYEPDFTYEKLENGIINIEFK